MILIAVAMPGYFGHAESLAEGLGAVFDVEHADLCPAGGDDLPAARVECTGMEVTPARPAPDRGDIVTRGGLGSWKQDSLPAGVAGLGAHGPSSVSVSLA